MYSDSLSRPSADLVAARSIAGDFLKKLERQIDERSSSLSITDVREISAELGTKWKNSGVFEDRLINDAYRFAHHYLADTDVIASYVEYRAMMKRQLHDYILKLSSSPINDEPVS